MAKATHSKSHHKRHEKSSKPSKHSKHSSHSKHPKHSHRSHASSSSSRMQQTTASRTYTIPGPHGSTSVRSVANSPYLHARHDSYAIRDPAYIKQVYSTSGEQTVVMNFQLSPGLLIRPHIRQPKILYPDGTFLHSVPMSDITVLSMNSVYRHGRGREYINTPSEVYGRDSVLIVMRSMVLEKLKRNVARLYEQQYPNDRMYSFGQRDQAHPEISFVPCTVRPGANFIVRVKDTVKERRIDRVVGSENPDLCGDALVAMKYVRNLSKRTAELVFELDDVIIRRGGERLLQGH